MASFCNRQPLLDELFRDKSPTAVGQINKPNNIKTLPHGN